MFDQSRFVGVRFVFFCGSWQYEILLAKGFEYSILKEYGLTLFSIYCRQQTERIRIGEFFVASSILWWGRGSVRYSFYKGSTSWCLNNVRCCVDTVLGRCFFNNTTTRIRSREGSRKMWLWYSRYTCHFKIEFVLRFSTNILRLNVWKNGIAILYFFLFGHLAAISVQLETRKSSALSLTSIPANARYLHLSADEFVTVKMKMLFIISRNIWSKMGTWFVLIIYLSKACAHWGGVQFYFPTVHVVVGRSSNPSTICNQLAVWSSKRFFYYNPLTLSSARWYHENQYYCKYNY